MLEFLSKLYDKYVQIMKWHNKLYLSRFRYWNSVLAWAFI